MLRLPRLRGIYGRLVQRIRVSFGKGTIVLHDDTLAERYRVVPPFGSTFEVAVWEYISQQSPYWQPQIRFGRYGIRGSTTVDFLNSVLGVALYVDGAYVHRYRDAQDIYSRESVRAQGFKIVAWVFETLEDVVKNVADLYARDIGR